MNYIDLYENAVYDLKNKTITLEEYDEITKPLRKEVDSDIKELEKIKEEIQDLIDFEDSCCGNTTLGYECLGVINDKIKELKGK